ncbi:IS21 family transposase [Kitasatospora sp. RB6PN24]|uniref:Mu transposase domain-containing protein n=1 Tax=Kitasatospora humi TaxID=2893891 RepID=UPI001E5693A2|nr:IS21 family transposase [Kitasatospora humi]MCC9312170.1 IS21 family transposase [Kitasatospora humi]
MRVAPHDDFLRFIPYCQQRLDDDPHLQASALYTEVLELGYQRAYSTFTRALRRHVSRPHCAVCSRNSAQNSHVPLEEVYFDWVQLPNPPTDWNCGRTADLLMGALTRSGRWRAAIVGVKDLPHTVQAVDQVLRRLGGTGQRWLFDRTPPVCSQSGKSTTGFQEVATYYGATLAMRRKSDPPNPVVRAHRSAIHHWWATAAGDLGVLAAQGSLDCLAERSDGRRQRTGREVPILLPLPSKPFPARTCVQRRVDPDGLIQLEGNFYALPAELAGATVKVRRRLDEPHLAVTTTRGAVIACFDRAPEGAGRTVIASGHTITIERPARPTGTGPRACPAGKIRRPRSQAALAEAQALARHEGKHSMRTEAAQPLQGGAGPTITQSSQSERSSDGCRARLRHLSARTCHDRDLFRG